MIFENMNISQEIKKAIEDMGYTELTYIQENCIPIVLEGKDVIGQSQTGTGKTAAFAIPILENTDSSLKKPQTLILLPTRELAVQVTNEFNKISKYLHGIKAVALYGGEPIHHQILALKKGPQIIIGTPGRTIDHINRKTLKIDNIKHIVLDEADEMLNMGFREDIELILEQMPEERQMLLFSATMPKPILDLTNKFQKSPVLIKSNTKMITADTIEQEYSEVDEKNKIEALSRILDVTRPKRCIIFCNMKHIVDDVTNALQLKDYKAEKIHGDLKQEARLKVLDRFNKGLINILVATDVAARGLDIKDVDVIINYDVPEKEDYYVHRIGRSGRAGRFGRSITLVTKKDRRRISNIMHYTKKHIEKNAIPTLDQVNKKKTEYFMKEISDIIDNEDLDQYLEILNEIDTEKYPLDKIVAALIKSNLDIYQKTEINDINAKFSEDRNRTKDSIRLSGSIGRPSAISKDFTRLFINVGRLDGINANHIVGAFTGEANITKDKIGVIDIFDKFSFVNVKNKDASKIVKEMNHKKIKGKKISIERAKINKK